MISLRALWCCLVLYPDLFTQIYRGRTGKADYICLLIEMTTSLVGSAGKRLKDITPGTKNILWCSCWLKDCMLTEGGYVNQRLLLWSDDVQSGQGVWYRTVCTCRQSGYIAVYNIIFLLNKHFYETCREKFSIVKALPEGASVDRLQ